MYQVLYRKYRPRGFSDVIGQPQVTVTLKNELKSGRIAHAYLFTGTRGTGKTTCAQIFAKAVNCLNLEEGDPCGECEICRGLDNGSIMDVVELDAASNNGVDHIRALIEEAAFTPTRARYRVYIVDEVHMLSVAAFNALLKTLEEPPPHVLFILATTEVHKLLPTILSRCQRFDFRRIAPSDIAERLVEIAEKEESLLDEDAALQIARIADGGMRDALSLFDQCLSRSRHVTMETVRQTAGIADESYLAALAQAVVQKDSAAALALIAELYGGSKDMARLCEEISDYFRSLMIIKTSRNPSQILLLSDAELADMTDRALTMPLPAILHALDTFEECRNRMRYGNLRIELEMAFVRLCTPELDDSNAALLRRLNDLETKAPKMVPLLTQRREEPAEAGGVNRADMPETVPARTVPLLTQRREEPAESSGVNRADMPETVPARTVPLLTQRQEQPAESGGENRADIPETVPARTVPLPTQREEQPAEAVARRKPMSIEELSASAVPFAQWEEILRAIRSYSSSVAAAFDGSSAYVSGDYLLIDAPQFAFDLLKRPSQRERIRDSVRQITGQVYKLGPYQKSDAQNAAEADPLDDLERRAKEAGVFEEESSD